MRIKELDGLRAIAIFAVFANHFRNSANGLMSFGWVGVDLFFAISGFLITGILLDLRGSHKPFTTFYWRRTLRILPPYYVVLFALLILAHFNHEVLTREDKLASIFATALREGISVHFMFDRLMTFTFPHDVRALFLPHWARYADGIGVFWSLSVEELFYLLWAPIILKGSKRLIAICAIAPLFLCPILRAFNHASYHYESFGFFTRFDALSVGACLVLLLRSEWRFSRATVFTALPVSLCALIFIVVKNGYLAGIEPRSTMLFTVLGYTALGILCASLVGCCVIIKNSAATALLRSAPISYLGAISYMMYLIHMPIYVALGGRGIISIACTIAVAALSWKYLESPILRLKTLLPRSLRNELTAHDHLPAVGRSIVRSST